VKEFPESFEWINRRAVIRGEDFEYEAVVLCSFPKTSGKVRYVVEDRGRIFVQREAQIRYLELKKSGGGCPHCGFSHPPDGMCTGPSWEEAERERMKEVGEVDDAKFTRAKEAFKEWQGELVFRERHEDRTPKMGKFEVEEMYRRMCDLFGVPR
jgi:hypothetical protein